MSRLELSGRQLWLGRPSASLLKKAAAFMEKIPPNAIFCQVYQRVLIIQMKIFQHVARYEKAAFNKVWRDMKSLLRLCGGKATAQVEKPVLIL